MKSQAMPIFTAHTRHLALTAACLVTSAGVAITFNQLSINRTDIASQSANELTLRPYLLACAVSWVMLSLLAINLRNGSSEKRDTDRIAMGFIVVTALVLRVWVAAGSFPQLSDDIWRYAHDGAMLAQGRNPYALAPAALQPDQAPVPSVLPYINHPDLVTIYQPTSQWVFAAMMTLRPAADTTGITTLRLGMMGMDLCVIVLLLVKLRGAGFSPWWVVLYAWHPLAISEFAGSGHQDVIGIAFLLAAWLAFDRARTSTIAAVMAGLCFACAAGVKPIVTPLAIPMVWMMRDAFKRALLVGGAGIVTLAALYLSFALMPGGLTRMFDTVDTFVRHWQFNGSLHEVFLRLTHSKPFADLLCTGLLLWMLITCIVKRWDLWRTTAIYFFAALLLSNTVHPWYLLWALAFIPVRFSPAVWIWSLTIGWSYLVLTDATAWRLPDSVRVGEYLPVYATLCYSLMTRFNRRLSDGGRPSSSRC